MKTVKFIKDHPAGIPKGTELEVSHIDAQRWVNQGLVTCDEMKADKNAKADLKAIKKAYSLNDGVKAAEIEEDKK